MSNNEIKKDLYRKKPTAFFQYCRGGHLHYISKIKSDIDYQVFFEVPVEDIEDATFYPEMPGYLLIRYISDSNFAPIE